MLGTCVNLQVRKADPVPASSLNATQPKSGDRVHLPDLQINVGPVGFDTESEAPRVVYLRGILSY